MLWLWIAFGVVLVLLFLALRRALSPRIPKPPAMPLPPEVALEVQGYLARAKDLVEGLPPAPPR